MKADPTPQRYGMLALVTFAQVGVSVVQQALGTLAPAMTAALALSSVQFGALVGGMQLGSAGLTALAGAAVDAYGERRMILTSGLVTGTAIAIAAIFGSYWWLLPWMTVFGAGYAASTPAGGRAILLWFTRDRGLAMGIRQMGVPLGGLAGALTLPLVAGVGGYRAALLFGAACAIGPAVLAAALYRAPERAGEFVRRPFRQTVRSMVAVARDPRLVLVMLTGMVLIVGQTALLAFFPLYLVRAGGLDAALAGAALAVAQLGASAGRLGWGLLSDRIFGHDRVGPLMVACIVVTLVALTVAFLPMRSLPLVFPLAFIFGFGAAGWNGVHSAAQVEIGGADRAGSALGVSLTGLFASGIVAAPLFGHVVDAFGFRAAWSALAAVSLAGLIPALLARRAIASGAPA